MPPRSATPHEKITAAQARRLLLEAQGLTGRADGAADHARVYRLIERMGFVQIDTISVVERAHHLILASRLDAYRPERLAGLLERERSLFEHWTHDASAIPTAWFAHWKPRFERYRRRDPQRAWWKARMGPEPKRIIAEVLDRIERDGPIMSRDIESPRDEPTGIEDEWWRWKPHKCALEHLWRCGELAVARRVNFQKVYDLTRRVLPHGHAAGPPGEDEHVEWACASALERLGCATPRELAAFWNAITLAQARAWCDAALRGGRIVPVEVQAADGSRPRLAVAFHDWRGRLESAGRAPRRARLLCPFDPVLRDRERTSRLFNFDYRFEAFVPAAKRRFGYYVMPVLDGEQLVARVDPKFDRARGILRLRRVWWEPGVRVTPALEARFDAAVDRLARFLGADSWSIGRRSVNRARGG